MRVEINGRNVTVDDKLVHAYELAAGKFNDKVAKFLLKTEGYDVTKLTGRELEEKLKETMEKEVKQMEYLSRPEVIKELVEFTRKVN